MAKYLDFNVTDDRETGGKIRVCYDEVYDSATNATTLTITALQVQITNASCTNRYYPDGELWLTDQNGNAIPLTNVSGNEKTVLTFKSTTPTAYVDVDAVNTWYDVIIDSTNTAFTTTTYSPIVHDHEGSEIVNISLGIRTDSGNPRFAFYTDDSADTGYSWGTIDTQTITLTVGESEPEEPLVIPDHAYGKQQYLFNGVKLPKLPDWDKTTYPHFFIRYHETDGNGYFSLIATDAAGTIKDKIFLNCGEPLWCLYNGVKLPPLPEWDKVTYPYAFIYPIEILSMTYIRIKCFSDYEYAKNDTNEYLLRISPPFKRFEIDGSSDEWGSLSDWTSAAGIKVTEIVWANFDILNEDGSVYLAASDPIPIYE